MSQLRVSKHEEPCLCPECFRPLENSVLLSDADGPSHTQQRISTRSLFDKEELVVVLSVFVFSLIYKAYAVHG